MSLLERIYFFHSRVSEGRFPNAVDLTREFEISPATAHRDIAYLRDRLLAPLAFDQQHNGYFYQEDSFRLPFEETPKLVLCLGLLETMARESGIDALPEMQQLQAKLDELVVPDGRRVRELLRCEWIESEPVAPEVMQSVLQSLTRQQRLRFSYRSKDTERQREVDPLKLLNYQGRWYLLAWCHLRGARRLFHLAKVNDPALLTEKAAACSPEDEAFLSGAFGIFKGDAATKVEIAFTGWAAETVRLQRWHPQQELEVNGEEIRLCLPVADEREIIMKTLQFGRLARIIAPESLRALLQEETAAMAELYRT